MSNPDPPVPFADNWAYLKTELSWLDRMLMLAVSRQKRDLREIDDFATSVADRVTSHWWKGIIAINRSPTYDDARPPKNSKNKGGSYSQQLEARIQASHQRGIVLALPQLRDRFQLSQFEKNVIVLALAPEVNQRFGRIYSYLQYQHDESDWDLPTVDLCLRLLCRNDQEWRRSRPLLTSSSRLLDLGILEWVNADDTTLLSRHLRVNEAISSYLLSEDPDPAAVVDLLESSTGSWGSSLFQPETPDDPWDSLILPTPILNQLNTVAGAVSATISANPIVLFHGEAGTGKTKAARVLAAHLALPLVTLDLAAVTPPQLGPVLENLTDIPPRVLLLESAQHWLGRSPTIDVVLVKQVLDQVRSVQIRPDGSSPSSLTILTVHYLQSILPSWRQRLDGIIGFPHPDESARNALWQQAIPKDLSKDRCLSWVQLAKQLPLTGGEITILAQTAIALAHQSQSPSLTVDCLNQALALHHPTKSFNPTTSKASKSTKR